MRYNDSERRRYYPEKENVPVSTAISEAIEAHEQSDVVNDELDLFSQVDPDAIDKLFRDTPESDIEVSVQFHLTNVTVSVWSDGGIDIRVSDKIE